MTASIAAPRAQAPGRGPSGGAREVPTERASNVFFARVTVNGREPFWFTVDTGATLTVIDPALAKTLGLVVSDSGQRSNVGVGGDATELATTRGVTIKVGGEPAFTPVRMYVIPVSGNAGVLQHRIDGVLGTDFLRRSVVEFDYRAGRVVLHDPGRFAYGGPGVTLPVATDGNQLVLRAELTLTDSTTLPARLLVDTGSNSRFTLNAPFTRRHRLDERFPNLGFTATAGINGVIASPVIKLRSLALGGMVFDEPEVALSRAESGLNASEAFDGIITADLLDRLRMLIDYPAGRLILERPPGP